MEREKMAQIWFLVAVVEACALVVLLVVRPPVFSEDPTGEEVAASTGIADRSEPELGLQNPSARPPAPALPTGLPEREELQPALVPGDSLGITVHGTVRDPDGAAVDGCGLNFRAENGDLRWATAEGGTYALAGLRPGAYRIKVTRTGFLDEETEVVLAVSRPVHRLDFLLRPTMQILVRFETPEGTPLHEAVSSGGFHFFKDILAVATREPLGTSLPPGSQSRGRSFGLGRWIGRQIGGRGRMEIPAGFDGILLAEEAPPFVVSAVLRETVLASVPVPEPVPSLIIEIPLEAVTNSLASLRFSVVDARTAQPITGFSWSLRTAKRFTLPVTSESSEVLREGLTPGWHGLEIGGKEYGTLRFGLLLAPGEDRDLGAIFLAGGVTISGSVVDEAGQAVPGARIRWRNLDRDLPGPMARMTRTYSTNDRGEFTLSRLPPDRVLLFTDDGAVSPTLVDLRAGDVEGVLVIQRDCSSVSLQARPANPEAVHLLTVFRLDGIPLAFSTVSGDRSWRIKLLPGSYSVAWSEPGGPELGRQPLEIPAEAAEIEIPLP